MKTTILKLCLIILSFSLLGMGCEKDDDLLELQIGDEDVVILKEVNGIEFKFCLLNEQGEPATVFNEGENFIFQFSFKNLKKDTIIITTEFINDEFFRVYRVSGDSQLDMGKSWTGIWCDFSLTPQELIVPKMETGIISIPWSVDSGTMSYSPLCSFKTKENPLYVGDYQTSFNLNFHYKINGKERIIDNLKFKINFEIK